MRWWWLLVLAACGRSHFDDAAFDTGSNGGTGDFDTDGVPDATDNCPAQFNTNQADGDGDGVGDACDPDPSSIGDKLVARGLFSEGFGDWIPDDITNWSLAAGKAETTAATDVTQGRLSVTTIVGDPTVELAFIVEDYGAFNNYMTVTVSHPAGPWSCIVTDFSVGQLNSVVINEATNQRATVAIPGVLIGSTTTMRFTRDNVVTCTVNGNTTSFPTSPPTGSPVTITIDVEYMKVALVYAMLYGS